MRVVLTPVTPLAIAPARLDEPKRLLSIERGLIERAWRDMVGWVP